MIVEEKKQHRLKDLLSAAMEQVDLINRIVIEADPKFERSKLRALLQSKKWPVAVNPNMILDPNSESDLTDRAESVLDWMVVNLHDKKFLDYGCGEGHVAKVAADRAEFSAGFDIKEQNWGRFAANEKLLLTTEFEAVLENGPYDVVLLYDVLDHVVDQDPKLVLKQIRGVLKDNGKVFVRCHPWCSKHGTHAYQTLNKAFVHLFFSPEELEEMGHKTQPARKILHPILTYDEWFAKSGFKKVEESESVVRDKVDPFFEDEPLLCKIIKDQWKDSVEERLSSGKVFPGFQLEQSWCEFILIKSNN